MEWLKPIVEKLNFNAFILAVCIASFIVWLNLKNPYLLLIWLCTAIYLIIVLIWHCYSNYRYNTQLEKSEQRRKQKEQAQISAEHSLIDMWYEAASVPIKQKLVSFMSLRPMPGDPLTRFGDIQNGKYLNINESNFQIPNPYSSFPIMLLQTIHHGFCETTYIIHPHLYDLVQRDMNRNYVEQGV